MSALDHQEGGTHYAKLKIQPIEYIHANGLGFAEGSVIKYVTRWRDKNGIADLKKARHFLDLLIELEGKVGSANWNTFVSNQPQWVDDKELPSSGIYGEQGYTEDDLKAASLVHDAELDPELVSLCGKTEIHADADGWHVHVGNECPVSDGNTLLTIKAVGLAYPVTLRAESVIWNVSRSGVTHWRYAK